MKKGLCYFAVLGITIRFIFRHGVPLKFTNLLTMGEPMNIAPALLESLFNETFYPENAVIYYDLACVLEPNMLVRLLNLLFQFI